MRGRRWLLIETIGLGTCLLVGCLHHAVPPEPSQIQTDVSTHSTTHSAEQEKQSVPSSDYLVSRTSAVQLDAQPAVVSATMVESRQEKPVEKPAEKPVEPLDMRIKAEASSLPSQPPEPPEPHREAQQAPPPRPDAPSVRVLRGLLEHHPDEEIKEQLKPYDQATRESMLLLLGSIAQLEQGGGIARISPRDLATWTDRLNLLSVSLRSRSQLILDRMCFCRWIKNFGDFEPLPPEHTFFQPGEMAHVYVQVRNFSSRREKEQYVTVLKGRVEIFDENNRDASPPITWGPETRVDVSASPRQDFYINFRFRVPPSTPAGLYTMRISVEDWTEARPGAQSVPEWRIGRRKLDFRVGGPIVRQAGKRVAETAPGR
jgi:hypothetical protein